HELPTIASDYHHLFDVDIKPFSLLIQKGLMAIMTTHALYPALDAEHPATFSAKIINLLKNELKFTGAVLTDDMEMGAVLKNQPLGAAVVRSVLAGHDLVLLCRRADYIDEARRHLAQAINSGQICPKRIDDAHNRCQLLLGGLC
ncbi:MAG: glycoside hydrolase family 3 N-terminal domain-containing protein, partial [Candidatus Adiutrix sp.]